MKTAESEIRKEQKWIGITGVLVLVMFAIALSLSAYGFGGFWFLVAILAFVPMLFLWSGYFALADALGYLKKEREGKL